MRCDGPGRDAYDQHRKAREKKARQADRDPVRALTCADCRRVPEDGAEDHRAVRP
ncbi:hypothetical protein ATKI12_8886 [Kitasatospora sp. Ki12]